MAFATISDADVVEAHIGMPRVGVWTVDAVIDSDDAATFAAGTQHTLKTAGGLELTGTILPGRSAEYVGSVSLRMAAGAAGMSKPATPRSYRNAKVSDVVNGLLKDAGESISSTADTSILSRSVDAWLVLKQPVSRALTVLLEHAGAGASWRILPDGKLWIGSESWPDVDTAYEYLVLNKRTADNTAEISSAEIVVTPGMNVPEVGHVSHVEHWITPEYVRSVISAETGTTRDRVKGALLALAKAAVPGIDYFTHYRAKVVKQSGQKVDLQPDDARLPGLSEVPLREGLPGVTVEVATGSYIRLGWDNGDPRRPYASLWDGGETVTKIVVKATMVYLGDESGAEELVKKSEFNEHIHQVSGVQTGVSNINSGAPTVPATGTTQVKAV